MPANFFDSNILLYLASDNSAKANRAEAILAEGGAISVQVLNEVANVARRKMRMSWRETHGFLAPLRALLTVHPIGIETHDVGMRLAERYELSLYDSLIAASALLVGSDVLWSEDMQDGMVLDGRVRIVNPFS